MRILRLTLFALLVALLPLARGGTPPAPADLRAVAEIFARDGDLARARSAIGQLGGTPRDLLAALREVSRPAVEPEGGTRTFEIQDGSGKKTEMILYAPPTEVLKARTKPLGLVCMLHGLGGRAKGATPFADRIIPTGEYACVAPTAQKLPEGESLPDGIPELFRKQFKHWWSYDDPRSFTLEAIRKAQELLWIDPDRIILGGVSMGGYGTWNIGLRRPDHFAALAPIAGGISRLGCTSDNDPISLALLENGRPTPVWSAHGTKDPLVPYDPDREACEHLEKIGGHVTFKSFDANHTPAELERLLNGPVIAEVTSFILAAHRDSSPPTVTYVSVSEKLDGAFWLRIQERVPGRERPRVDGKADRERNRIEVTLDGVRKARVYLDERLLDASREVEVVLNGKTAWRGKIEPSVESILESWRSRRDPGLVYPAHVDVGRRYY
ncbi:MAG TPA: hypothetical protein VFF73_06325 [Planctomycetota bacterium]|nr:hypothetical protein [Planctomycetota bacterium]